MIAFEAASLQEVSLRIRSGELSPVEHVQTLLSCIAERDHDLHAFLCLDAAGAMAQARQAERELLQGQWRGPLHGVGYATKDLIDVAGLPTTAQSRVRAGAAAVADAHVTAQLRAAGAICLGKLATDEFACGGAPVDGPWPVPLNPWNAGYITGGSSSGSAVAVAAGLVPLALGTDTGGSIRNPSSRCGLVGMKPTYGRVGRTGLVPLSWSQDHVGPMTRTVADNALALSVIAGHDALDPTCSDRPIGDYVARLGQSPLGLRLGVLRHVYLDDPAADARQVEALEQAIGLFREAGMAVCELRLEGVAEINAVARLLLGADGYAEHADALRRTPELFGGGARRRLVQGAWLSADDYLMLQRRRAGIARRVAEMMAEVDVVLAPNGYDTPPRVGDAASFARSYGQQLRMPFNLTGHPALALPCGIHEDTGMPLSMQIVGHHFHEEQVYQVAAAYERLATWSARGPG